MFGLGPYEMLIVGVVAVLLFGSRLPSVARSAGRSLTEFKRGMQDLQEDVRRSIDTEEAYAHDSGSSASEGVNEQYTGDLSPPSYEPAESEENSEDSRPEAATVSRSQPVAEPDERA